MKIESIKDFFNTQFRLLNEKVWVPLSLEHKMAAAVISIFTVIATICIAHCRWTRKAKVETTEQSQRVDQVAKDQLPPKDSDKVRPMFVVGDKATVTLIGAPAPLHLNLGSNPLTVHGKEVMRLRITPQYLHGKSMVVEMNGCRWKGDIVEGLLSGEGVMEDTKAGITRTGHFHEGLLHGQGHAKYKRKDGTFEEHEGIYEHGRLQGKGKITTPNFIFDGTFVDGKFVHGIKTDRMTGVVYNGGFNSKLKLTGPGKMIERKNDLKLGEIFVTYVGLFDNDALNGLGSIVWEKDGKWFQKNEGTFVNNELEGDDCSITHSCGRYAKGRFSKNKLHGQGYKIFPDKSELHGNYVQGKIIGQVTRRDPFRFVEHAQEVNEKGQLVGEGTQEDLVTKIVTKGIFKDGQFTPLSS